MHLLVLDATPSLVSIREQVRLLPEGERVSLLCQPGHSLPNADVILVLLRRLADREHLDLGLVTDDRSLRRHALALGLPAFRDVQSAERNEHVWTQTTPRERVGLEQLDARQPDGAGYE